MTDLVKISAVAAVFILAGGCQKYAASTPRRLIEGSHASNYRRIFHEDPPTDVTIINSVLVEYSWRLGVNTTDDWEIELLAPPEWISETAEKMDLRPLAEDAKWIRNMIAERKAKPIRSWYAPEPLANYRLYYLGGDQHPVRSHARREANAC